MSTKTGMKTALITGCSAGGIGDALAQSFHRQGLRVFATARNLSKIQHLKDMGLEVLALDVVDTESRKRAVAQVEVLTGGTLDILVNNSGVGYSAPLADNDIETVRNMFEVNVFAVLATTQAFLPLLLRSKGTVVNIGSIAGVAPFPWQGMYNASKAAVHLMTDNLRIELEPFGIKVILVVTGGVRTNFFNQNPEGIKLADNSIYSLAKERIEDVMTGKQFAKDEVDVNVYAEQVVTNVLKSRPTMRQWAGGRTTTIWAVETFFWAGFWDIGFSYLMGVRELRNNLRAKNAGKIVSQ